MEKNIKILMLDGCTKEEAEKHLKKGSIVFTGEDFKNNFETYMAEWGIDGEEEKEEYRTMIESKNPLKDWGIVESEGDTYYIMYVL